jgi:hypothetical protein
LTACGSGGSAPQTCCSPAPFYLRLNSTTTSAPVPDTTTQIVFSSDEQVSGTPHLNGSDGSSFDAGAMTTPSCLLPSGSFTEDCVSYASVSTLQPHTTYAVTIPTVTLQSNNGGPLSYSNVNAGSFTTQ